MRIKKTQLLRNLQAYGAKKARELGITSEDDVDRLVHEYRARMSVEIYSDREIEALLAKDKVSDKERKGILKNASQR